MVGSLGHFKEGFFINDHALLEAVHNLEHCYVHRALNAKLFNEVNVEIVQSVGGGIRYPFGNQKVDKDLSVLNVITAEQLLQIFQLLGVVGLPCCITNHFHCFLHILILRQ